MVRACNTVWACNVLRYIDPNYIIHYFVHVSKSCNFALSSSECQFKSFTAGLFDNPGFVRNLKSDMRA